jgi:hypothetical protein
MSSIPISTFYESQVTKMANAGAKLEIKSMLTSQIVEFPAFITSFNQSFTSNWSQEEVYGRMDPIATFQNTTRAISLAFDLPASNIQAAQDHLARCDLLAQFLYPGYIDQKDIGSKDVQGKVISRPPLVAVKYANLVSTGNGSRQLGWLSGLDWSPVIEMGMFVEKGNLYPKVISLSFTLNVLHQNDKGWGKNNSWLSEGFFGGIPKDYIKKATKKKAKKK